VCIYTSLEPCYQCAGKMLMSGVRRCVWLQDDPLIPVKIMAEVSARDPGFRISSALAADVIHYRFLSHRHMLIT
jgi:tRNA(Arg) A34 adenosine deaminase TadA